MAAASDLFLREQDGHSLYYGAVSDITVQKQREQLLINSQRALSAVVHISENDSSFMKLTEGKPAGRRLYFRR